MASHHRRITAQLSMSYHQTKLVVLPKLKAVGSVHQRRVWEGAQALREQIWHTAVGCCRGRVLAARNDRGS